MIELKNIRIGVTAVHARVRSEVTSHIAHLLGYTLEIVLVLRCDRINDFNHRIDRAVQHCFVWRKFFQFVCG